MIWIGVIFFLIFIPLPVYVKISLGYVQIYGFKHYFKHQFMLKNNKDKSISRKSSVPLFKLIKIRSLKIYLGNQTGDFDTDLLFYICSQAILPLILVYLKSYKIKADIYIQKKPWEHLYFEGIITICLAKLILEILRR